MLTFEQIKELIELVAGRQLSGLEMERSGFRLRIDGKAAAVTQTAAPAPPPAASAPSPAVAEPAVPPPAADAADAEDDGLPPGTHVLTSPIVGTFYSAPSPESDPFVAVDAKVRKGQVLCIVEAMKLMNEIEADVDGTVIEIFPQNAQAVEFGEPLFAIRPD